MNRWIISDTHFFHDNIVRYCERPANHTQLLVENLVNMVRREDVLYHLGDVHFGTEKQLKIILAAIPGRKYLVRGNHDRWTDTKYLLAGFDGVSDALVVGNNYLTHIPTLPPEGMVNIHGHLHNLGYVGEPAFGEGYGEHRDDKHILYAPEIYNYRPVKLEWLLSKGKRGDKDAMHQIHLSRRKRVRDQRMPQWLPSQEYVRGGPMPFFTHLEGSSGATAVDWYSVNHPAFERNQRIFPEDR